MIKEVKYSLSFANEQFASEFNDALLADDRINQTPITFTGTEISFTIPRSLVRAFENVRKRVYPLQYKQQLVPMTTVSEYVA
jgi:hypothetical protein